MSINLQTLGAMQNETETQDVRSNSKTSLKERIWQIANAVMAIFLFVCVFLQYNDPDPELWMPMYGVAGLLTLSLVRTPSAQGYMVWKVICAIEVAYCVALATYTVLYFSEETKSKPHGNNPLHYEETRELLGIVLVMVWMTVCLFYSPERQKRVSSSRPLETLMVILIITSAAVPFSLWAVCMVGVFADQITYCRHMCSGTG